MAAIFLGVNNASTIQPIVDTERGVFYRRAPPEHADTHTVHTGMLGARPC